ncbi:MAG: very short patch repair endonuclease [Candidatus Acidiferrales bacterium]
MADIVSTDRRSENMRRIRSKGTKPEIAVRRLAHSLGHRFRLHRSTLPGKPDLVFPTTKKIVEVRGCFWHQHPGCIDSHIPKSRIDYWGPKLEKNVRRDRRNVRALRKLGWDVLVIWECEVRPARYLTLKAKLRRFLGHK